MDRFGSYGSFSVCRPFKTTVAFVHKEAWSLETLRPSSLGSSILKLVVFPNCLSHYTFPLMLFRTTFAILSGGFDAFENLEMIEIGSNCNHSSIDFVSLSFV